MQWQAIMTRTLTYRLVDRLGRILRDRGLVSASLDPQDLCAVARNRARLEDFGGDEFIVPLNLLVRCLEEEASLTFVGRVFVREILIQKLINRLLLSDSLRRHPEIADVEIRAPIFITGLPRTGTTFLHRVMAQDPTLRHLQMWEVWKPAPPPDPITYATDPRRKNRPYNNSEARGLAGIVCELEDYLIGSKTIQKRQAAHFVGMVEPEECQLLFMNSFMSQEFVLFFADAVPSYAMWLLHQDLTPSYEYYRRQLQLLTWKFPHQRLLLKSPMHLQGLRALFRLFPDATVIWTHRDPRSVVPSWSSLNRIDGEIYNNTYPHGACRLGPSVLEWLGTELDQAMGILPTLPREGVIHISFRECARNTLKVVLRLRARLGLSENKLAIEKMQDWTSSSPSNSQGVHEYDASAFGLTDESVDEYFSVYRRAFAQYL
ncbi:MAG: sulfotransferase [Candidatus Sulfotelmatobacter sp.]